MATMQGINRCVLFERNLQLPFCQNVPLNVRSDNFLLEIKGKIKSAPPELKIKIMDYDTYDKHFEMHLRHNENRAVFSSYIEGPYFDIDYTILPEYAYFPSLKLNTEFSIKISALRPNNLKVYYKIQVNHEPVVLFENRGSEGGIKIIEIAGDDSTAISLAKLDIFE